MNPPSAPPDSALAHSDDARWFVEEVKPHESRLRAWLRARFPSLSDIDDIVQEAYFRVLRARRAGKVRAAKPYLYSTARNAALDVCRHEQVVPMERIAEVGTLPVLDERTHAFDTITQDEELALLSEAIHSLPARCREILMLRKLHGLSQKEIARKLGISENTVAAQASLGVRRCIEYFRARNCRR